MAKSLITELPKIVEEGRREAQRMMERIGSGTHIGLQTNEVVLPSRDISGLWKGVNTQICADGEWKNRLIYGDNLLAIQTLKASWIMSLYALSLRYLCPIPKANKKNAATSD